MKLIWFGHSCFRLETGNSVVLVDPFLKGNPTFEQSGIAWGPTRPRRDHVALTHGHSDHIGDAGEICKTNAATLLATFELAMYLKGKGAEKLEPMNTGGTVYTADFDLTLVNALHSSSTDVYLGNPNGIVIKTREGKTVYFMATRTCSRTWPSLRNCTSRMSVSCPSATASPWGRARRPSPARSSSISRQSSPATMAPSPACSIPMPTSRRRDVWRQCRVPKVGQALGI